jgi:hypothetical protein
MRLVVRHRGQRARLRRLQAEEVPPAKAAPLTLPAPQTQLQANASAGNGIPNDSEKPGAPTVVKAQATGPILTWSERSAEWQDLDPDDDTSRRRRAGW